jgi:hypothetical protein
MGNDVRLVGPQRSISVVLLLKGLLSLMILPSGYRRRFYVAEFLCFLWNRDHNTFGISAVFLLTVSVCRRLGLLPQGLSAGVVARMRYLGLPTCLDLSLRFSSPTVAASVRM